MIITSQPLIATLCCLAVVALLLFYQRRDVAEYREFKSITDNYLRLETFRTWAKKAFVVYTLVPVALLAIDGRVFELVGLPAELQPGTEGIFGLSLGSKSSSASEVGAADFVSTAELALTIMVALACGIAASIVVTRMVRKPVAAGDVDAIIPRNGPERKILFLLIFNAAVGEELMFRLLLPLLLVCAGIPVPWAVMMATILFGIMHAYQGIIGIFSTLAFGFVLHLLYFMSGTLILPIAMHFIVNLNGLFVRPLFAGRSSPTDAD